MRVTGVDDERSLTFAAQRENVTQLAFCEVDAAWTVIGCKHRQGEVEDDDERIFALLNRLRQLFPNRTRKSEAREQPNQQE